jgi:hypothetical protein
MQQFSPYKIFGCTYSITNNLLASGSHAGQLSLTALNLQLDLILLSYLFINN